MWIQLIFFILHLASAETNIKNVDTENKSLEKKIYNLIKRKKGIDQDTIDQLLKERGYFVAETNLKSARIEIINATHWDLFFSGNKRISHQILKKMLAKSTFTPKIDTFDSELKNRIKEFYKNQGFHFIQVDTEKILTKDEFNKKTLIKINEGSRVNLNNFKIAGELSPFTERSLIKKIKDYSGPPVSKGYYSANSLKSGIISLQNDLKNLGYFKSNLTLSSLSFNKNKSTVNLNLELKLDEPTTIKNINFTGADRTDPFILKTLLGFMENSILDLYQLEKGLKLIEDYYYSRGFLNVFIDQENIVNYSDDISTATLNIEILERHQIIVDKIKLVGLVKTKPYVVFNELEFKSGQVLTLDKIRSSVKNLQELGIFSNVTIKPDGQKSDSEFENIIVSLNERKPGTFAAGLGLNTELGLTLNTFINVDYENLWGTARSISSQLELSRNLRQVDYLENKISLSYLEPYFIGKSVDGRVNLSRVDEIWNFNDQGDETLVTIIESNRLDLVLDTYLNKKTRLKFYALSLDLRNESELNNKFDQINEFIASFGPRLEFDYRDQPFTTRNGTLTEIRMEYATPLLGSNTDSRFGRFDLEYFQVQSSFAFYKPIRKNLILAQAFRGGYLYNFAESTDSNFSPFPKSRAFFLGGASTIRGFDPSLGNERIPNDEVLEEGGLTVDGQTLGGGLLSIPSSSHYYLSKTELRFPISKSSNFWGTFFYDGGSVQIKSGPNIDPWRHSIGLGLRYITPLGPLFNIEIAYKLDRKSEFNESAAQIHLSIASF